MIFPKIRKPKKEKAIVKFSITLTLFDLFLISLGIFGIIFDYTVTLTFGQPNLEENVLISFLWGNGFYELMNGLILMYILYSVFASVTMIWFDKFLKKNIGFGFFLKYQIPIILFVRHIYGGYTWLKYRGLV